MPKATREQQLLYENTVEVAAYRPRLSDPKNQLRLVEMDEVPEPDEQGRRRADGWKAVWEGVVDPGRCQSVHLRQPSSLDTSTVGRDLDSLWSGYRPSHSVPSLIKQSWAISAETCTAQRLPGSSIRR
jgi:hypothetical protein